QALWAVRRLAAPGARKTTSSGITASRQGVKLTLLGIAAARPRIPNAGPDLGGRPRVWVAVTPPTATVRLALRRAGADRGREIAAVVLGLTAIGQNLTMEQWYGGLLERIGQQLGLEEALEQDWQAHSRLDPVERWMSAIQEVAIGADGRRQTGDDSEAEPGAL